MIAVQRFPSDAAMGEYLADRIAEVLRAKPDALLSIAAGTTSFPAFDAPRAMPVIASAAMTASTVGIFFFMSAASLNFSFDSLTAAKIKCSRFFLRRI